MEINRQGILDTIEQALRDEGLSPQDFQLGVRSFGGGSVPAVLAFIRLSSWQPQTLLRGKQIERRIRLSVLQALGVRVGYVYWRIGSDVDTPFDEEDRYALQPSAQRLQELNQQARAQGAQWPSHAPVTNWAELEVPTDLGEVAADVDIHVNVRPGRR